MFVLRDYRCGVRRTNPSLSSLHEERYATLVLGYYQRDTSRIVPNFPSLHEERLATHLSSLHKKGLATRHRQKKIQIMKEIPLQAQNILGHFSLVLYYLFIQQCGSCLSQCKPDQS